METMEKSKELSQMERKKLSLVMVLEDKLFKMAIRLFTLSIVILNKHIQTRKSYITLLRLRLPKQLILMVFKSLNFLISKLKSTTQMVQKKLCKFIFLIFITIVF